MKCVQSSAEKVASLNQLIEQILKQFKESNGDINEFVSQFVKSYSNQHYEQAKKSSKNQSNEKNSKNISFDLSKLNIPMDPLVIDSLNHINNTLKKIDEHNVQGFNDLKEEMHQLTKQVNKLL